MAIATDGVAGNLSGSKNIVSIRRLETQKALKDIGDLKFFNCSDGKLELAKDFIKKLKEYINFIGPDLIITHPPEDYHSDHRALSHFVKEATGFKCPIVYADTLMGINFAPEYYVEITPYFETKANAIMCHKSQSPEKFLQAITLLNRFRSAQCNSPNYCYAEAFRHEKRFPFADIRNLLPPAPKVSPFYQNNDNSFI
jgi:LmbE family N-acetylglucosaminyl deacetylase